jgi:hypothetical protein
MQIYPIVSLHYYQTSPNLAHNFSTGLTLSLNGSYLVTTLGGYSTKLKHSNVVSNIKGIGLTISG